MYAGQTGYKCKYISFFEALATPNVSTINYPPSMESYMDAGARWGWGQKTLVFLYYHIGWLETISQAIRPTSEQNDCKYVHTQ